ncbi:Mannosyltransferase APTG1 [Linum perenne]
MRQRPIQAKATAIETNNRQNEDKRSLKSTSLSDSRIFASCLAFRIVNSLLIQTYFNPDEHWQSLEVAHRLVFGYGHLTWEWKKGIRSYLHPLLFAAFYKVLAVLGLDTPWIMVKSPRLLQALFSAFGDMYCYKLSAVIFGATVARWALFSQLTNWFMFFCFNRTLSNSLETVLTLVGLYHWPCMRISPGDAFLVSRKLGLLIAGLACAIRPTCAVTWVYVGLLELILTRDRIRFLALEVVPIGALILGLSCLADRVMYGSWVFVPLNFLKFNFLSSGGDYYGTHPWHWFVLPVLPIALMFSGYSLAVMAKPAPSNEKRKGSSNNKCRKRVVFAVFFLLATNIPMALYMSLVHQRGTEDVMIYLSKEARGDKVSSILFLMPCHASPYYSSLHYDVPMCFLDCTPSEERGIPDESDRFMMDPVGFMEEFSKEWSQPSHIVLFEPEERLLKDILASRSFEESQRFFHAHFKVDRDLQASVVVYTLAHH